MEAISQTFLKEKVSFEPIGLTELEDLVRFGFGDDMDLLNIYQQYKGDFETMVKRNMSRIIEDDGLLQLSYYKVIYDSQTIGFTVVDLLKGLLFSFGINIKFRAKKILIAWIEGVKELLEECFYCPLYNENKRAIEFLKRNGMKEDNRTDSITYLIYR